MSNEIIETETAIETETEAAMPLQQINSPVQSFMPSSFAELLQFCELVAGSDIVPTEFRGKPANILVAVQKGMELGLKPLAAMANIAVINGKPALYGDGLLAIILGSPFCQGVSEEPPTEENEWTATCTVHRAGKTPCVRTFAMEDAKVAGLWGKAGPWKQYPKRMLQMRARGFAIRDQFADLLSGVVMLEEAQDYEVEPRNVTPPKIENSRTAVVRDKLRQQRQQTEEAEPVMNAEEVEPTETLFNHLMHEVQQCQDELQFRHVQMLAGEHRDELTDAEIKRLSGQMLVDAERLGIELSPKQEEEQNG